MGAPGRVRAGSRAEVVAAGETIVPGATQLYLIVVEPTGCDLNEALPGLNPSLDARTSETSRAVVTGWLNDRDLHQARVFHKDLYCHFTSTGGSPTPAHRPH